MAEAPDSLGCTPHPVTVPASALQPAETSAPRVALRALTVRADRIVADVQVDPAHSFTTPALAAALVRALPDLPHHACANDEGDYLAAVLDHTSWAHVLEHAVIDLQTRSFADACPDFIFTGITRWTDAARGLARVEVSFRDDVACIRAFRDAAALINGLR